MYDDPQADVIDRLGDALSDAQELSASTGDHTLMSIFKMVDDVMPGRFTEDKRGVVLSLLKYADYYMDDGTSQNERKRFAMMMPSLSPWKQAKAMAKTGGGSARSSSGHTPLENIFGKN
jgi:hypothetical protein